MNKPLIAKKIGIGVLFLLGLNFLLYAFFPFEGYKNYIRAIIAAIIFLYLVIVKKSFIKQEVVCIMISAMVILSNGNMALNVAFLVLSYFCIREVSNLADISFKISIVLLALVLFGFVTHLVSVNIYTIGGRTRNTLGFYNVNAASLFFYSAILLFLYSRTRVKVIHMIVAIVISYLLFLETDSRTPLIGILAYCVFILIFKFARSNANYIKTIVLSITVVCFASPVVWSLPFINSTKYNILLSERPYMFNRFINQNSILNFLIGGTSAREIDNFYLMFLYNVGVVIYIIFAFVTIRALLFLLRENKHNEVAFVISILLVGLMESSALRSEILCMVIFWNIILNSMFTQINNKNSEPSYKEGLS